jgi:hypothetical protein
MNTFRSVDNNRQVPQTLNRKRYLPYLGPKCTLSQNYRGIVSHPLQVTNATDSSLWVLNLFPFFCPRCTITHSLTSPRGVAQTQGSLLPFRTQTVTVILFSERFLTCNARSSLLLLTAPAWLCVLRIRPAVQHLRCLSVFFSLSFSTDSTQSRSLPV